MHFEVMQICNEMDYLGEYDKKHAKLYEKLEAAGLTDLAMDRVSDGDTFVYDIYVCMDERYARQLLKGYVKDFEISLTGYYADMYSFARIRKRVATEILKS